MRMLYRTFIVVAAMAAATFGTLTAVTAANGTEADSDQPSSLVEDFSYPGADKIFADYGVQLISGDGHILFADCPTGPNVGGFITVQTTSKTVSPATLGKVCFRVSGTAGQLSLKIPAVYSIQGDGAEPGQGHKLKAQLTTDAGQHTTVDVNPSGTTQVGIAGNPPGDPTTLLQLNASS
jgi:hypothetical protein